MKIALRVAAALLLLVVLVVATAVALAPRILGSVAVRGAIGRAAAEALGRSVQHEELRVGLFPPSLIVVQPAVAGEHEDSPLFATARNVSLQVALLPLLAGAIVVDSVVIDGPVLNIERTKGGVVLLGAASPTSPTSEAGPPQEAEAEPSGVSLAVLSLEIRDGTIIVLDSTLSPAVEWRLQGVTGKAHLRPAGDSFAFELATEVATGGRIEVRGEASFDAELDAVVRVEELVLGAGSPYLAFENTSRTGEPNEPPLLEGFASGSIEARGAAASPDLVFDLALQEGLIRFDEIEISGPLQVTAVLSGPLGWNEGSFDIDATHAEIRYSGMFTKPAGTKAQVSGRIVSQGETRSVEDIRLKIANLDARASLDFGERRKATVEVAPFDLEGWDALVPALAGLRPRGWLRIDAGELRTAPLDMHGVVGLDGITIAPFGDPPAQLDGELVADGDVLRTRSLTAMAAGQTLEIEATVSGLASDPWHRVRLRADGADTNALLSAYAGVKDAFYGKLDLRVDLAGTLAGEVSMLQSLEGSVRFEIEDGRLVGVSLLEAALESVELVVGVLRVAGFAVGGSQLEPFYGDEFDSISGTLEIADGVVSTEDLRLVYPSYAVDLRGTLRLEGLELDMKGQLAMGSNVASVMGGGDSQRDKLVISLASVRGTLLEPEVVVTPDVVSNLISRIGIPTLGILDDLFGSHGEDVQ